MDITWKSLSIAIIVLAGFGLVLLWLLGAQSKSETVVGLNQEIQFDDFAFSALGSRKAATLGASGDQKPAEGLYYIVTIKVANHAKRVDFKFDPSSAVLLDRTGKEYHLSARGQEALDSTRTQSDACAQALSAGASCVTEIVFEVPADISDPHLKMSFGGKVGEFLDSIFYGKRKIALEPEGQASH